jgi:hypothetical protein
MQDAFIGGRGVLTTPDAAWDTAVRIAGVIGPLAARDAIGLAEADAAAAELLFAAV